MNELKSAHTPHVRQKQLLNSLLKPVTNKDAINGAIKVSVKCVFTSIHSVFP